MFRETGWERVGMVLMLAAFCFSVPACSGSKVGLENFGKIKVGMTEQQVADILGPPTDARFIQIPAGQAKLATWKGSSNIIEIQFDTNGKVIRPVYK